MTRHAHGPARAVLARLLLGGLGLGGAVAVAAAAGSGGVATAAARVTAPVAHRAVPATGRVAPSSRCAAGRAAGPITWVSPFSYSSSATILDVFAAKSLGYFAEECLDVRFVTSSFTPVELVSTGVAQITGEGSAADALQSVANGSNIVAVGTDGDESLYSLLTPPGITRLGQLVGKSLAYHQALPVAIEEMLAKEHVPLSRITLVDDNSYDPTLLTRGLFSALQAFRSNEPLQLRASHLSFHEFTPAQYGVKGTMGVTVVNGGFLARHPVAVADFMRADLEAFAYCATHAQRCVTLEAAMARAAGVTYDVPLSLERWRMESAIVGQSHLPGKGVGVETLAEWRPEAHAIVAYGVVKSAPPLAKAENTSLVASLYRGTKLIWP